MTEQNKLVKELEACDLKEQIRVQKSISDAHYENYCEMLKRVDAVARERDKARDEVAQLRAERDLAQQLGRDEVSAELERLKTELAQAISERTPHDYGILQDQRDHYRERLGAAAKEVFELKAELLTKERHIEDLQKAAISNLTATVALVRPEPSRLEIAAMLLGAQPPPQAGSFSGQAEHALRRADALIAAAKEVAK